MSGPLDLTDLTLFSCNTLGGPAFLFVVGDHSSPNISGIARMGLPAVADPAYAITLPNPNRQFPRFLDQFVAVDFRPGRHGLHHLRPDDDAPLHVHGAGAPDLGP